MVQEAWLAIGTAPLNGNFTLTLTTTLAQSGTRISATNTSITSAPVCFVSGETVTGSFVAVLFN